MKCRWCHTPIDFYDGIGWVHAFSASIWCGNRTHQAEPEIARTRQEKETYRG